MNDKNEAVQGTDCGMRKEAKMHLKKTFFDVKMELNELILRWNFFYWGLKILKIIESTLKKITLKILIYYL